MANIALRGLDVKTFFPMNGKPIVTRGSCKQYMIQEGKCLQSDFTFFNSEGTKSTGTGISGFDPKTLSLLDWECVFSKD